MIELRCDPDELKKLCNVPTAEQLHDHNKIVILEEIIANKNNTIAEQQGSLSEFREVLAKLEEHNDELETISETLIEDRTKLVNIIDSMKKEIDNLKSRSLEIMRPFFPMVGDDNRMSAIIAASVNIDRPLAVELVRKFMNLTQEEAEAIVKKGW